MVPYLSNFSRYTPTNTLHQAAYSIGTPGPTKANIPHGQPAPGALNTA
jgi:hypothetical protein